MVILNWKQKLIKDRKTFYFKSNVKGKPNNIWNWSAQFLLALIKIMTKAMAKIIIKVTNKSIFSDILREDERREPAPWPLGNLSRSSGGASNIIIIIITRPAWPSWIVGWWPVRENKLLTFHYSGICANFPTHRSNFPTCQNNFSTCQNYFPTCPAKIIFPPAKIIFPPALPK